MSQDVPNSAIHMLGKLLDAIGIDEVDELSDWISSNKDACKKGVQGNREQEERLREMVGLSRTRSLASSAGPGLSSRKSSVAGGVSRVRPAGSGRVGGRKGSLQHTSTQPQIKLNFDKMAVDTTSLYRTESQQRPRAEAAGIQPVRRVVVRQASCGSDAVDLRPHREPHVAQPPVGRGAARGRGASLEGGRRRAPVAVRARAAQLADDERGPRLLRDAGHPAVDVGAEGARAPHALRHRRGGGGRREQRRGRRAARRRRHRAPHPDRPRAQRRGGGRSHPAPLGPRAGPVADRVAGAAARTPPLCTPPKHLVHVRRELGGVRRRPLVAPAPSLPGLQRRFFLRRAEPVPPQPPQPP
eukprot:Rhum_TRINITY_DN14524_c11_g1::Rhum_TRINITY_DN14524_c11_g1_i1::g.96681::m.96681